MKESTILEVTNEETPRILRNGNSAGCGVNKKMSITVSVSIVLLSLSFLITCWFIDYEESFMMEDLLCFTLSFFLLLLTQMGCVSNDRLVVVVVALNCVLFTLLSCKFADAAFTIVDSSRFERPLLSSSLLFTTTTGLQMILSLALFKIIFEVNRVIGLKETRYEAKKGETDPEYVKYLAKMAPLSRILRSIS